MTPKEYKQMMDYLTRKGIKKPFTPASAIQRPKKILEIEAFQDFNARNKLAGGGMLVQPSADGSRPGYAKDEKKAAYMREYYKKQVAPSRKMTEAGAQRVKRTKALDEYIKTLGKVVNTDDLYKKLEELGFEYDNINSKIDKLKRGKLKGKTFTKKTIKKQEPRMDKKQLKEFDKYAKFLKKEGIEGMEDTYAASTDKAKQTIRNRSKSAGGKFTKDAALVISKRPDTFTESQKNKIKAAFNISDADFAASGTQYGVPSGQGVPGEEGKALKRRYALVRDFVDRGFKEGSQKLPSGLLRKEDQLPLDIQTEIKTKYELPEDYINKPTGKREWDFTRHKYGVPGTKGTPLRSLVRKIEYEFVTNPSTKKFKFVGDFKTPQGWIMAQMYRAGVEQGSPNYQPISGMVDNTIKIVGFTDNTVGGDFYVRDEFVQPGGKPMRLHPDFNDVKKFIDVANKANSPLQGTLKGMLKQIGVVDNRLTMTTLLNYLAREEGYNATNRALVLHHKGGVFENATRDLQLLRNINNSAIQGAENRIRSVVNLGQTPDKADIKILKDNRASVTVGGQTFGAGPQTPGGAFRFYEKFIGEQIKQGKIQKKSLLKFIETEFGKLNIRKGQEGFVARELLESAAKGVQSLGRTLVKYGIAPEAAFLGAEQIIRTGLGDTPKEGFLRTTDFIRPGDQTKEADVLKTSRLFGDKAGLILGRVIDNEKQLRKIESLEQQKKSLEALSKSDFGYLPETTLNIKKLDNALKQATFDLNNKFKVTDAEKIYANRIRSESFDRSLAKSPFTKRRLESAFSPDPRKSAPQAIQDAKSQMDLNLKMLPTPPKILTLNQDMSIGEKNLSEASLDEILQNTQILRFFDPDNKNLYQSRPFLQERDRLRGILPSQVAQEFSPEQAYGASGIFGGEPVRPTPLYDFANGGIAGLSGGDKSGPPPEKGPNPQGLLSLKNRVRNL